MNREQRDCGYCGMYNGHMSHWTYGTKRFCCKEHRELYITELEQRRELQLSLRPPDANAYDVT